MLSQVLLNPTYEIYDYTYKKNARTARLLLLIFVVITVYSILLAAPSGGYTASTDQCVLRVVIPFIRGVRFVDAPAGVTQEKGHEGYLRLPFAVLALTFLARRIQPSLSLVDRKVEPCVSTN